MTTETRNEAAEQLLCPACHHRDHDPGSCNDCPRCELHYDEAIEWLRRGGALAEALAAERRATVERIKQRIIEQQGLIGWDALAHYFDEEAAR